MVATTPRQTDTFRHRRWLRRCDHTRRGVASCSLTASRYTALASSAVIRLFHCSFYTRVPSTRLYRLSEFSALVALVDFRFAHFSKTTAKSLKVRYVCVEIVYSAVRNTVYYFRLLSFLLSSFSAHPVYHVIWATPESACMLVPVSTVDGCLFPADNRLQCSYNDSMSRRYGTAWHVMG